MPKVRLAHTTGSRCTGGLVSIPGPCKHEQRDLVAAEAVQARNETGARSTLCPARQETRLRRRVGDDGVEVRRTQ
ncbi:hypothetical protein Tdes44962_MAKER07188 [Teratosphaeria destructans]|uniref:Uncharacterized protein n=1 Tax=Teratosphaeria destructans TaxID=418781 RepID=A0A9W7W694_9PEZI|nr:hypothetical protein Tdes44962_MAKER07188 [Teratosphaeria destructans]